MTDDDLKSLALDFRDQMVGIDLLRAVFQAGAASRDAEIAELQRNLANEQARDIHSCHPNCAREGCVNRRLRAELAAALAACKVKDEALNTIVVACYPKGIWQQARGALAIQPDDAALKAWLGEPECFYDGYKFYSNEMSAACDMANLANLRPLYSPKGLK